MLVDSHCHLNCLEHFDRDGVKDYLARAKEQGVTNFLCAGIDLPNIPAMIAIAEEYPQVWCSIGLHPNEEVPIEPTIDDLLRLADHPKVIAIGETGLDYYRSNGDLDWQRERFRTHIRAAIKKNLPIIVHSRDAKADTLRILEEEGAQKVGGVLHCFTGDLDMALRAIELGFLISFSGIVTFSNAKELQAIAKALPLEKILIETDAPYLAPVPHRGKSNEPAFCRHVADYLAVLKGVELSVVAERTTGNFFKLFSRAGAII